MHMNIPSATLLQLYCIDEEREVGGVENRRGGACKAPGPNQRLISEKVIVTINKQFCSENEREGDMSTKKILKRTEWI